MGMVKELSDDIAMYYCSKEIEIVMQIIVNEVKGILDFFTLNVKRLCKSASFFY